MGCVQELVPRDRGLVGKPRRIILQGGGAKFNALHSKTRVET